MNVLKEMKSLTVKDIDDLQMIYDTLRIKLIRLDMSEPNFWGETHDIWEERSDDLQEILDDFEELLKKSKDNSKIEEASNDLDSLVKELEEHHREYGGMVRLRF